MKFFLDTANLDQIREAYDMGVLDGVTTNPSLMAKEGIKGAENQHRHYIRICEIVNGDVSAEVIATDYEGMIEEAQVLTSLNPHIVANYPVPKPVSKELNILPVKGYGQIVHWYSRSGRLYWLPKPALRMYLRL